MSASGGDLSWLKPLNPEGNLSEEALGCHKGDFSHMNVRNWQTGFTYAYARRNDGRIRHYKRMGYRVVTQDDPEYIGDADDPDFAAAGLDSSFGTGDVILMKCPTERVRKRQQERIAYTESMLKGVTDEYLDRAGEVGGNYHSTQRPIRYRRADHRLEHGKSRAD